MDEVVTIWESHKIDKPEFRLYYDDKGCVIAYTCDKLEGNYLVIDALAYAESRPDVRVVDGQIIRNHSVSVVSRLCKDIDGALCESEDVSIITKTDGQYWKLVTINIA